MYIQFLHKASYKTHCTLGLKLTAMKKLYSLRMESKLLEALRDKADKEDTTVSELIHRLLSDALGINTDENEKQAVSYQDIKSLMDKLKDEVKAELRNEIISSAPSEIHDPR